MLAQLPYNYLPQKDSERKWIIKDIHDGRGFGVYANEHFSLGDIIGDTHYIMGNMAFAITELGRFHNHSDEPNCSANIISNSIELEAIKEIKKGEELTVNYDDYGDILNIEKKVAENFRV